jgi:competence protein ComEC
MSVVRRTVDFSWPTMLVAAACLGLGASNWLRPPVLVLAAALAAVAAAALGSRVAGDVALAAIGAALALAGLWWGGVRLDALERTVLAGRIGASATAELTVTEPPRRTPFGVRAVAQVHRFAGAEIRERVLLVLPAGRAPPLGAVLRLRARPLTPRGPETGFDERRWLARRGIHVVLDGEGWRVLGRRGGIGGVADRLRAHVARSLALGSAGERRALVGGVVLGADDAVPEELRDAFRASGLYHLMAVSGQNVAFVIGGVLGFAWLLGLSRPLGHVAALAAVVAYVLSVGWQPSVVRAGVAGALASLAWLASRPRDRWHFLALGALVLLVWAPTSLLEPGFQLSFVAVGAIFVLVPRLQRVARGYPVPPKLADVTAVALACGVVTAPVMWLHFGAVALWTVPANVLAEPAVPIVLGCGLAAAAAAPVLPSVATALGGLAGLGAAWLALCARTFADLPFAQVRSGVALGALAAGTAVAASLLRAGPRGRSLALTACLTLVPLGLAWHLRPDPPPLPPPKGLRVTFLDVGQGDAALLQVAEGAVLVDQGPPEAHVARQLRRLGVRTLTAVVLTHPQRDHVGGAAAVLRTLEVGTVLDPGLPGDSSDEAAALAAARERQVQVVLARAGRVFRLGRLVLRVLWPDGPGAPGTDPNDRAVVLLASYGETDVFLPADAESNVTTPLALHAVEVLKVAHHGSADVGLGGELRVLRPRIAVVSVGAKNDYGHPRPETIAALEGVAGLRLFRTDVHGRVVVETDGRRLAVTTERG